MWCSLPPALRLLYGALCSFTCQGTILYQHEERKEPSALMAQNSSPYPKLKNSLSELSGPKPIVTMVFPNELDSQGKFRLMIQFIS
jgi:hypothetical protein